DCLWQLVSGLVGLSRRPHHGGRRQVRRLVVAETDQRRRRCAGRRCRHRQCLPGDPPARFPAPQEPAMIIDWTHFTPGSALAGGILIGLAAAWLILVEGRILGAAGILGGLVPPRAGDWEWRAAL